jgi:hypothetical protein
MGFFDKVFGGKTTGGLSPEEMKDFRILEDQEKGFSIIVPQGWQLSETPSGLEARPAECGLVTDPASGQEVPTPRLTITLSEIAKPGQNMIKATLQSRAAELKDHQLIKHHASSVKGADNGIVYEYQYGPKESPLVVLGVVAQRKNRLFIISASGTSGDFDRNRSFFERAVFSFKLI